MSKYPIGKVIRCYELGASSYVTKPCSFSGMLDMARTIGKYWLQIVELPSGEATDSVSMEAMEKHYGKQGSWAL